MSAIQETLNMEVQLPGDYVNAGKEDELITKGVEEALSNKEIKNVIMQYVSDVEVPSYLVDMSDVGIVTEESLRAIQGLLSGGDTALYIKNNEVIEVIGHGDGAILYKILHAILSHMYNNKCKIYTGTEQGFKPFKETEVSNVRLNL